MVISSLVLVKSKGGNKLVQRGHDLVKQEKEFLIHILSACHACLCSAVPLVIDLSYWNRFEISVKCAQHDFQ